MLEALVALLAIAVLILVAKLAARRRELDALAIRAEPFLRDFTPRSRSDPKRHEREARLRGVFESQVVPMFFWRADHRITDANDAFLELVGAARSDLARGPLDCGVLTPQEPVALDAHALELPDAGRLAPVEQEYVRPDGRRVPVLVARARIGSDLGIGVAVDLTALREAEQELRLRRRFERLALDLSAAFATSSLERAEAQIPYWLGRLGESLSVDRVSVLRVRRRPFRMRLAHAWSVGEAPRSRLVLRARTHPYAVERARQGQLLRVERLDDLPSEAATDRVSFERQGIGALLVVPLRVSGERFGVLALSDARPRPWPEELVGLLRLVGEIFANVLARKAAEGRARQRGALNAAVLASLPGGTAVVDRTGTILQANEAWERHRRSAAVPFDRASVGANYRAICREAADRGDAVAARIQGGLEAVLDRNRRAFSLVYLHSGDGGEPRHFELMVEALSRREGGAVVALHDRTALVRAESEAYRHRMELAHMTRVATMGELAGSLAHELNQPLTAILSNAQAGRRMLAAAQPDIDGIRDLLTDICDNDRRAGEVVHRMRTLLKKGEHETVEVDLNDIVRDVVHLLGTDLQLRQVSASLELDGRPLAVRGDAVQLQQVVMNLILNGAEAMAESPHARRIRLRTARRDERTVELVVHDAGPGIPPDCVERVFDAFYTTKPNGLGMGLAITRSIVQAHGGRVSVADSPQGGAAMVVTLPRMETTP